MSSLFVAPLEKLALSLSTSVRSLMSPPDAWKFMNAPAAATPLQMKADHSHAAVGAVASAGIEELDQHEERRVRGGPRKISGHGRSCGELRRRRAPSSTPTATIRIHGMAPVRK
jgi:hypothetical protein